ncbi:MAG: lysostaphin resistance A-like protein [Acidimicrobiales bacterium]
MVLLATFVAAELAAAFVSVPLGAAIHAAVIVVALNRYVLTGRDGRAPALLPVIALLSAARLTAIALPVATHSIAIRATLVGAPAVLGALLLLRHLRLTDWSAKEVPQRANSAKQTLVVVVLAGAALGALAAIAEHLHAPVFSDPAVGYPVTAVCLGLFSAAAEELGFRRLLLPAAQQSLGAAGAWLASTTLFAATYLASRSVAVVAVAVAGGLVFTWAYMRSRSTIVPVVGHAVATVGAFLVWPAVVR